MKQNYTDIIIVLDRSGSMQSVCRDTIGGVNKFLDEQKKLPGEATFSLFQFDDQFERVSNAIPIGQAQPLDETTYVPRGNTCLFGAIGTAIHDAGKRLESLAESERPAKVVFVIVTDGEENSSHKHEWSRSHSKASVKSSIDQQTNAYKWQFVYIGANQDAFANAAVIGIAKDNAMNYTANARGTEKLYGALSANVGALRASNRANMSWDAKQREDQAEAKAH